MPKDASRDSFDFTVPDSIREARKKMGIDIPKVITLRELTANDELQASRVGKFDLAKTRYDSVKRAIAEFDGRPVSYADDEIDRFWEQCGAKLRTLLLTAFETMTAPTEEEQESFLTSKKERLA
jgi:hypothetical protein